MIVIMSIIVMVFIAIDQDLDIVSLGVDTEAWTVSVTCGQYG
jgi:hypothetical protein